MTINKKLKIWDLQRRHLTSLLVEVKKNLDIDFIVCADIYKYCCLYWCSSEKAISAHIVKDYYDLPLIPFHSGLKALENTASLRKGTEEKEECSTHTPLLKCSYSE